MLGAWDKRFLLLQNLKNNDGMQAVNSEPNK